MVALTAVAAGGLVGSASRSAIVLLVGEGSFPVAILVVNLVGSFLLGYYVARRERAVSARYSLHFWGIGALGAFTTFSTFSVDLVRLLDEGHVATATLYVMASLVGGLVSAVAGLRIGAAVR